MLKQILNIPGVNVLTKDQQKTVKGGAGCKKWMVNPLGERMECLDPFYE